MRLAVVDGYVITKRFRYSEYPTRGRGTELGVNVIKFESIRIQTPDADIQHSECLLDDFRKGTTDCHDLANAFHFAADLFGRAVELRQIPAGALADDIVQSRLEERRRPSGNTIGNLWQRIAESDLGRDIRERVTGGFACQCARAGRE